MSSKMHLKKQKSAHLGASRLGKVSPTTSPSSSIAKALNASYDRITTDINSHKEGAVELASSYKTSALSFLKSNKYYLAAVGAAGVLTAVGFAINGKRVKA